MAAPNHSPNPNRMACFTLCATGDLAPGFLGIGPAGGLRNDDVPHFFSLKCVRCNEPTPTDKDVCLYLAPPEMGSCSKRFGVRGVRKSCYPTCSNPAHMIRKCKNCQLLGSVELLPLELLDYLPVHSRPLTMYRLRCMGYVPVGYTPATTDWVAKPTVGEEVPVRYRDGTFDVSGEGIVADVMVATVEFQFVE